MVLISLLSDLSIVSTDKSSPSLPCYLEHHCDFEFRYFGDCGKLNSTTIKGYKQILGKFGEIQREFVDVYSPDSDNDCRGGGGGHQHLHRKCCKFVVETKVGLGDWKFSSSPRTGRE